MAAKYFLEIRNEDRARELVAFAYGDAAQINFIGRSEVAKLLGDSTGNNYSFRLLSVQYIGQDPESDEVVKLGSGVADTEGVAGMLKRKLVALKKSASQ